MQNIKLEGKLLNNYLSVTFNVFFYWKSIDRIMCHKKIWKSPRYLTLGKINTWTQEKKIVKSEWSNLMENWDYHHSPEMMTWVVLLEYLVHSTFTGLNHSQSRGLHVSPYLLFSLYSKFPSISSVLPLLLSIFQLFSGSYMKNSIKKNIYLNLVVTIK